MPRVPVYRSQVQETALRTAKIDNAPGPEAFGGVIAQGLQQFGQGAYQAGITLNQVNIEEQRRLNKTKTRDVFNKQRQEDAEYLERLYKLQGKDAVNIVDEAKAYFEKRKKDVVSGLENPEQRDLFTESYDPFVNRDIDSIRAHQTKQRDLYDKATLISWQANVREDAYRNRYTEDANGNLVINWDEINLSSAELEGAVRDQWRHLGAEVVETEILNAKTQMHQKVINGFLVDRNMDAARNYFQKKQGELTSEVRDKLSEQINKVGIDYEAQIQVDRIMKDISSPHERREAVKKLKPEVREVAVRKLDYWQNQERTEFYDSALEVFQDNLNKGLPMAVSEEFINGIKYGRDKAELKKILHQMYNPDTSKIQTNFRVVAEVRRMIDNNELNTEDEVIKKLRPYASDTDLKDTIKYFREGGAKGGVTDSRVAGVYKRLGGNPEKYELYNFVWKYVKDNLPEGKSVTDEVVNKLVTEAIIEGETEKPGPWSFLFPDPDSSLAEAVDSPDFKYWRPDNKPKHAPDDVVWSPTLKTWYSPTTRKKYEY